MKRYRWIMPVLLGCLLALLAAPLRAAPPAAPPPPTMVLQVGHSRNITTFAYSPDGKTLATGSNDGTVRLWDVASGQLKATLKSGLDSIYIDSLAFSPDGETLATGSYKAEYYSTRTGPVQLWDVGSGLLKMGFDGAIGQFAFSPDGKTLATWGSDANGNLAVLLWDVASGKPKATLSAGGNAYAPLAFSPDSRMLATGGYDDSSNPVARLWDVASGQLRATLRGHTGDVDTLAFAPDGKTLATGSSSSNYHNGDGTVRLWDVASGQLKATLPNVSALAFSPDSQTLATGSQLWDVASGQLKATLTGGGAVRPAFSPDSKKLAGESYDSTTNVGTVRLWDVASGQIKATLKGAGGPVFAPDGKTLATWDYDANDYVGVLLWDVASGQLKATLKDAGGEFAFSTDGKTLATRDDYSGKLLLWDVAAASPITPTAQTSLALFPPWLTHPFSWSNSYKHSPGVSLLDPFDERVLATLQALPDAPASLLGPPPDPAASPTGGNWITTTPDGYFEGSANLAPFVRWNVDGVLYPAAAYWDVYYRPDLVQQALRIPGS